MLADAAADIDPADAVELPVGAELAGTVVVGPVAGGAEGLEDGDGGGAMTVYGDQAGVPLTTAPFWTNLPQTEYRAGVVPGGGWRRLTVTAPQ